jgi:cytochrome bd-type quinol oxidase subunit 1
MRTAEAVTDFPYKAAPFWLFTVVYVFLAVAVVYLLSKQILRADQTHGQPHDDDPTGPVHGA